MENSPELKILCERYPSLEPLKESIYDSAMMIINSFANGGKLLVCGNGGSSSDSDHIVGELMKSFEAKRPLGKAIESELIKISGDRGEYLAQKLELALPAISLSSQTSLTTAISNDIDSDLVFAQQIVGYGKKMDVLLVISSSGNSQNIIDACIIAKALELNVIGLTGLTGGRMKNHCDILINVPETRTAFVQELHLPIYHTLCQIIENHFYNK